MKALESRKEAEITPKVTAKTSSLITSALAPVNVKSIMPVNNNPINFFCICRAD